jgi:hypothetical protein
VGHALAGGGAPPPFSVGAGAVDAGDGDAQFAEVDAELAAVVDGVIQDQHSNAGDSWEREDGLAFEDGAPNFLRGLGRQAGDVGFGGGYAFVEIFENLGGRVGLTLREAAGGRLEDVFGEVFCEAAGDAGEVKRELA